MKELHDDIKLMGTFDEADGCMIDGINVFNYNWQNCYEKVFLRYKKLQIRNEDVFCISLLDKDVIFGAKKRGNSLYDIFSLSAECLIRVKEMQVAYRKSLCNDEKIIETYFAFLLNEYGFTYVKNDLGNAYDAEGRFFFYGPVYAHSLYNDKICFNILNLVQRQEYDLFVTNSYSTNQVRIRQGDHIDGWGQNLRMLASMVKQTLTENGTVLGYEINKK